MRVTQSMLSNNLLLNLNRSYGKMSNLQNQIDSGSKITRPSDDPVIAIRGMGYRTELTKNEQFTRNMDDVNSWLDTTDESLDQVGEALKRVQELVTQAANDTNVDDDRKKMKIEIEQIRAQIRDVANTKMGDKYIFSGTNTHTPVFDNAGNIINYDGLSTGADKPVNVEVFDGITINVNTPGRELFTDIDSALSDVIGVLGTGTGEQIGDQLGKLNGLNGIQAKVLEKRADVGARQNRVEMMANRLSLQEVTITKQMSNNEDVDYAKAITEMTTAESIHQAALSTGAKIIQQTLVDFL